MCSVWCGDVGGEFAGERLDAIDGELAEDVVEVAGRFGATDERQQGVAIGLGSAGIGDVGEEVGELATEPVAEELEVFEFDGLAFAAHELCSDVVGEALFPEPGELFLDVS